VLLLGMCHSKGEITQHKALEKIYIYNFFIVIIDGNHEKKRKEKEKEEAMHSHK